jgi:hypothetical protein
MKRSLKVGTAIVAGVAAGASIAAALASTRWARATSRATERLAARTRSSAASGAASDAATEFSPEQLTGLPAPVVRYFTFALTPGQPLPRTVRARWTGEFRASREAAWKPFTAVQHFTIGPPGFVWDAAISMAPLITVRVRDEYVNGVGAMLGKVAGLVPVVNEGGSAEMAAGALSRYLGEAVWFPTALLPGPNVAWTPVDDSTARATLTDGAVTVHGDFHFDSDGRVVSVSMMRYRDVNGRGVLTPFEGRLGPEYRRVAGMMVPSAGEVAWLLPEGRLDYWRGRLAELSPDAQR